MALASVVATAIAGPLVLPAPAGAEDVPSPISCGQSDPIEHLRSAGSDSSYSSAAQWFDSSCAVIAGQDPASGAIGNGDDNSAIDLPRETVVLTVEASEAGGIANGGATTNAQTVGNWVHSSQTQLDVINIDIARFRYLRDRKWDGGQTWWGNGWLAGNTEKAWNHPVGVQHHWTQGPGISAATEGSGDFHSDFLWCNLQEGQNFRLSTTMTTFKNGDRGASFRQSQNCFGTHMATAVKTSLSDQW